MSGDNWIIKEEQASLWGWWWWRCLLFRLWGWFPGCAHTSKLTTLWVCVCSFLYLSCASTDVGDVRGAGCPHLTLLAPSRSNHCTAAGTHLLRTYIFTTHTQTHTHTHTPINMTQYCLACLKFSHKFFKHQYIFFSKIYISEIYTYTYMQIYSFWLLYNIFHRINHVIKKNFFSRWVFRKFITFLKLQWKLWWGSFYLTLHNHGEFSRVSIWRWNYCSLNELCLCYFLLLDHAHTPGMDPTWLWP